MSLSNEIRFGSHQGFNREFILTEDVKEFIKKLKEELHLKSKTEIIFHCEQCKELVWDIIDKLTGDKLVGKPVNLGRLKNER